MPEQQKVSLLQAGYRVTSGSPLNLKKFLRGDPYARGLNEDMDIIDARLTSDTILAEAQEAVIEGQLGAVLGRLNNLVANSGFDHWQRGTSVSGANVFTADLWKTGTTFTGNVARCLHLSTTPAPDNTFVGPFSARISSSTPTAVVLRQKVLNLGPFGGMTLQFSASIVTNNSGRWQLGVKDPLDAEYRVSDFAEGTGAEERLSVPVTLSVGNPWIEVALLGTIDDITQHSAVFGDAALYVGTGPDPVFVPLSPVADLYRCLRHFFNPDAVLYFPVADFGFQPQIARPLPFPVQQSGIPSTQVPEMAVGTEVVPPDITVSETHVVLGTSGGSATAEADEALSATGFYVATDAF